jgi:ATP-dependent Clp protease ATP-binding subunit ClpC
MWEAFTDRAKRCIVLAQEEVERFGSYRAIDTEDILLGILSEGESIAAKTLGRMGVNLQKTRDGIVAIVGRSRTASQIQSRELTFTHNAQRSIEKAFEEAAAMAHNYVNTEHLLLGLLIDNGNTATCVLSDLGIDFVNLRSNLVTALGIETAAIAEGHIDKKKNFVAGFASDFPILKALKSEGLQYRMFYVDDREGDQSPIAFPGKPVLYLGTRQDSRNPGDSHSDMYEVTQHVFLVEVHDQ